MITAEDKFVFDLQGYIIIKNVLTSEEIAEIVSAWTNIPITKMLESERQKLKNME